MPCRDYSDDELGSTYDRQRLDALTKMLCKICSQVEVGVSKETIFADQDLVKWWTKHKKLDAEENEREAIKIKESRMKEIALSKLSKEERRLLGLKK